VSYIKTLKSLCRILAWDSFMPSPSGKRGAGMVRSPLNIISWPSKETTKIGKMIPLVNELLLALEGT
jgi:hypothetical protein